MNLIHLFIGIIIVLIFTIIFILIKLRSEIVMYNILSQEYKEVRREKDFNNRELERCKRQILTYEKELQDEIGMKARIETLKKNTNFVGKRALVGDYYYNSYSNTIEVLKSFGMIVDLVEDGVDMVEKFKRGYRCDIIFTNNTYKGKYDGVTTLKHLRKIPKFDVPVVVLTTELDKRDYFVHECGFDDYIEKVLTRDKLKLVLDKFLNSR